MSEKLSKRQRRIENRRLKYFKGLPPGKITPEMLDALEERGFELVNQGVLNELDVPITHTFTKHSYVREGVMPAGALVIGHYHKEPHHCIVLSGHMTLLNSDRTTTDIVGPASFMAAPGRKVGYMHTDVVMQNIHPIKGWPAECFSDVEAMEDYIYRRSPAFKRFKIEKARRAKLISQ
jgi:hypothetical protein